jgi:hypothetical protein
MNRLTRFVIVCAAVTGLAAPTSARLLLDDLPRKCWSEIGMVCGGEFVSTELCLRDRGNRLSERCQREIISRIEAAVAARAREERAKPDAAPGARPAL